MEESSRPDLNQQAEVLRTQSRKYAVALQRAFVYTFFNLAIPSLPASILS
jgi:hypothetical protein